MELRIDKFFFFEVKENVESVNINIVFRLRCVLLIYNFLDCIIGGDIIYGDLD